MNKFFSPSPIWQNNGLALVRIIIGASLIYHGSEMFDTIAMKEYFKWDMFNDPTFGKIWAYSGKVAELLAGILFLLGLFTRVACIIVMGTMLYISFFVGHGKIWYEDQYPFLFVLLGLIFFFTGPGAISLDRSLFKNKIQ